MLVRMYGGFPATIKLGTCKSGEEYCKALSNGGFIVSKWAQKLLHALPDDLDENDIKIDLVSVEELGFKDGACYPEVWNAALEKGLNFSPHEVAPALRFARADQMHGEWLYIGIVTDLAKPEIFMVASFMNGAHNQQSERHLSTCYAGHGFRFRPSDRFVFMRRK